MPFRFAHHLGLYLTGLDFLVHFVEGGSDKEIICPPLVSHADLQLSEEREVTIVEAPSVGGHILTAFLVPHLNTFHHIVVFRGVDSDCGADGEAIAKHILSVEVAFVRVV